MNSFNVYNPNISEDCYSRSYLNYKLYQKLGKIHANKRNYLESMRFYLAAAKGRENHCKKFFKNKWDRGHEHSYQHCLANAWLQKKYYLNDPNDYEICYERD